MVLTNKKSLVSLYFNTSSLGKLMIENPGHGLWGTWQWGHNTGGDMMDLPNISITIWSCHDVQFIIVRNSVLSPSTVRSYLITTCGGRFDYVSGYQWNGSLKGVARVFQWCGLRRMYQEQDLPLCMTERYSGPTRWDDIQVAQLVTRSLGCKITRTSKVAMSLTRSN